MPNGAAGDAPWSDFFVHGKSIFPPDMCVMLHVIKQHDVELIRHLAHPDMWDWEVGKNLEEGRRKLKEIIRTNGIPYPVRD